jgi:hypothetical protein
VNQACCVQAALCNNASAVCVLLHHDYAGLAQLLAAVAGRLAADLQQYSAASSVSNATSQQQQQQQVSQMQPDKALSAAAVEPGAAAAAAETGQHYDQAFHLPYCLLWLWVQLMQYLPHDSQSFRILMAGAALPRAVLRTCPDAATAALTSPSSSSSSGSSSLLRCAMLREAAIDLAVTAAHHIMQSRHVAAGWQQQLSNRQPGEDLPPLALAWASNDVQQLQLAHLACVAERLHAESSSSSGARRQERQAASIPAWHQQLFASLGMPAEDEQRQQQQQRAMQRGRNTPAKALAIEAVQLCAGFTHVASCHQDWIAEQQEQHHSKEQQQRTGQAVSSQQQQQQRQLRVVAEQLAASWGSNSNDSSDDSNSRLSRQYCCPAGAA